MKHKWTYFVKNIDINKERKFGYLYIPNEYMLDNTLYFINKVNLFFEEYKSVHGNYPCFKSGMNLLVHSRELSYHANYGAANGHPELSVEDMKKTFEASLLESLQSVPLQELTPKALNYFIYKQLNYQQNEKVFFNDGSCCCFVRFRILWW